MLVITCKRGDSVILDLGDGRIVKVVVREIGQQVRLGFVAPQSVRIHRNDPTPTEELPQWYRELLAKAEEAASWLCGCVGFAVFAGATRLYICRAGYNGYNLASHSPYKWLAYPKVP